MRRILSGTTGMLLVLTLLLGLLGCTGDDTPNDSAGADGSATPSASPTTEPQVQTSVSFGKIAGSLVKKQRLRTRRSVTRVVDRWLDNAYIDRTYPRRKFPHAFPGFTKEAARLARERRRVMSNATVAARIDGVDVKRRRLAIDVLAPGGKPAGVTARIGLTMKFSGKVKRTDRVRGRLLLTPAGKGWRIFGFDVKRGVVRRSR